MTKDWPHIELDKVTTKIGSGATPRGGREAYKESGISLIRSLNVYDFEFNYDDLAFIDDDQAEKLSNVEVESRDILLNITGASVTRCCIVPDDILPARVNQHVSIIRCDANQMDPRYLLYCLNSPHYEHHLNILAQGGATRQALTQDTIRHFEVPLPPLSTQRKIAAILAAYDDLIANNTRRIAILEEMAQLLYREWFVRFRFPGHEDVRMVDSEIGEIPEGWKISKLSSVAKVNRSNLKKDEAPEAINYITIGSVAEGSIQDVESIQYQDAPSRARRIVQHGDIIWSMVRPNLKSYALVLDPEPNTIVSTGFSVITPRKVPYTYLYQALITDKFVTYLTNLATGAAYPAVKVQDVKDAEVLVPSPRILERFHDIVSSFYAQKVTLEKKNEVLKQTRDLLLPRLIAGELDVADLELDTGIRDRG